jgi:pimeloyl-ACP methyl ester carboxylesterase
MHPDGYVTQHGLVFGNRLEHRDMPLQNSVNLHSLLSGQSTLITYPEAGHLLLIEEPENFASAIATFVSQF